MKNLLIIISVTVLFKPVFPVLDYVLNYDYIRTELCVNKSKPQMGCNGKCHLKKELAAATETEKPTGQDRKNQRLIESVDLFVSDFIIYELPIYTYDFPEPDCEFWQNLYDLLKTSSVFHPPDFIS